MKPVVDLLSGLRERQIKLWLEDGRLRYTAPQGSMTDELLEMLRSHKAEIIEFLDQLKDNQGKKIQSIPRDSLLWEKLYLSGTPQALHNLPLSFAQQRLWFLNQLEHNTATYNMPVAFRLQGDLDLSALTQSLQIIVERHESLRVNFISQAGQPVIQLHPMLRLSLSIVDLQSYPNSERTEKAEQLIFQERTAPFDLAKDPLIRGTLLQLQAQEHILLLTLHHIISDGWSLNVLRYELGMLYQSFMEEKPSPLPDLKVQYIDFAVWQRQQVSESFFQTHLSYWKRKLAGSPPCLDLAIDYPRSTLPTIVGASFSHTLSKRLLQLLKELGQRENATLFMTLLAAFKILLSRHSGTYDLAIGTPVSGRNQTELEPLIGFFINTLVLRSQLDGKANFCSVLEQVRETTLEAFEHQNVPFEALVEALEIERSLSYHPIFQVWFNMGNLETVDLRLKGLQVEQIEQSEAELSKFDLTLYVQEKSSEIQFNWIYNTLLFKASTIAWLACQFESLLESIVSNPEQSIDRLNLFSEAEYERLRLARNTITPVNQDSIFFPPDAIEQSIPERFIQQVHRYPDQLAVVTHRHQWTYQELNHRATAIASTLIKATDEKIQRIALLFEHDAPMVAAILGTLKAGKAYVPLDPQYPQQRLAYILEDSQVSAILTNHQNLSYARTLTNNSIQIIDIDVINDNIIDGDIINGDIIDGDTIKQVSNRLISPDTLAYILYTSGSTGQPKGVMQNHRNVLHFIRNYTNRMQIAANDKLSLLASYSFDAAVVDIFACLLNGATLYPIDVKQEGLANLAQYLYRFGVTIYHSTPTLYRYFLDSISQNEQTAQSLLSNIRVVILGGETAIKSDFELYQRYFADRCLFVNGFGSTEASLVSYYNLNKKSDITSNQIPCGYRIEDTEIILFNPAGHDAQVYGEIAIKSPYVALGYWRRPELTQQVFAVDAADLNQRIYRTGDYGRLKSDGTLEFLGRKDFQVKIRGLRIELGEIEATLIQHSQVREAVVLARADRPGEKQLVAYIVAETETSVTAAELRQFLNQTLPDYMVPAIFMQLETLPLTPNGKVDRKALPAPNADDLHQDTVFTAPTTPTQKQLAAIWTEVLAVEPIGIYDRFFDLGGHSLLATQVISRIRHRFEIELPLKTLFAHPTLVDLAQAVDAAQQNDLVDLPAIQPIARTEPLPLSFAQQRLWFLDRLEGASASYNLVSAFKLDGNLNRTALEQSLQAIVQRHESLRTTFQVDDVGVPYQCINDTDAGIIALKAIALPGGDQNIQIKERIRAETQHPFDLTQDRLMRCTLLQLSPTAHILVVTMHHIAADGWSLGIFRQELSQLYLAFCHDRDSPLPPLSIQYADFAHWQRQWFADQSLETQLRYWKEQLEGISPLLELPTDYPRPAVQTFRGNWERFELDSTLTQQLKVLSQNAGVTLFMTLLAAFQVLLSRYSRQTDIVVGSPIANRNQAEIEPLIGFFVNTVVLRADLSGNPSFEELLAQVKRTTLEAYSHQDLPFERLVEELQPERRLDHHPLVQVLFTFQNASHADLELFGLKVETLELEIETTREFDLELYLSDSPQGLSGFCVYSRDLFNPQTIQRLLGHFRRVLEAAIADRNQPIGALPLLTAAEQHQIVVQWNQTQQEYPQDLCIHHLFEQQVECNPDAIAVIFEEKQLAYQELNQRADHLACYLQSLGVGPDVLVGICIDRSLDIAIAVLAILKAGGAYVPLDPAYPQDRLTYMIENAGIQLLLTQSQWQSILPPSLPPSLPQILCLDQLPPVLTPPSNPHPTSSPESTNLAYVIYTSGSTGQPKGVAMPHQPLVNLIQWQADRSQAGAGTKTVQFAPISFDVSFQELFATWCTGGTVVLISEEIRRDPVALLQLLDRQQIARLFLPFIALQQLAEVSVQIQSFPTTLQEVITAGEQLQTSSAITEFFQQLPHCRLFNQYGPSESHVVTAYALPTSVSDWPVLPPIGQPIANASIYILDDQLQPVPIGVPGQLYIGGVSLAQGYLHRPELTAERFISNPFLGSQSKIQNPKSTILYQTGDLARFLPDGNIEFLGRIDHQVKLRGFRIELGEIESTLGQHPTIAQSIATVQKNAAGDKSLVAYLVPHKTGTDRLPHRLMAEVRQFLQSKLPGYMVPQHFVVLDRLPLTPSGKVNRRALPTPEIADWQHSTTFVAPTTPTQELLATIWTRVLGIQPIGLYDRFFDLGGHSLLATQVISRIRHSFEIELPLKVLFEQPMLADLAQAVDAARKNTVAPLPPIQPTPRTAPLPLSFAQQRLWFLDQLEGASPSYNLCSAFKLAGSLKRKALEQSLQTILQRHESLRTTFKVDDRGVPYQCIADAGTTDAGMTDADTGLLSVIALPDEDSDRQIHSLLQAEVQTPFDITCDRLIRFKLLQQSPTTCFLLVTMHHIVSDAWSMGVFRRELSQLYQAFCTEQDCSLPPLTIQYADFAHWQRQWLANQVLETQVRYWKQQLAGIPPLLELPTDYPRPAVQTFRGSRQRFQLDSTLTQQLKAFSQNSGVTLFMTLLAAFQVLLARYSDQTDIVVGSPIANRNQADIEPLIGFFVNTLVLRSNLSGSPSFQSLLNQVRQTTLDAYGHQDLPFEKLVEELQPERRLDHHPLVQVMFGLQNASLADLELFGLQVEALEIEGQTTREFDLELHLWENEQGLEGLCVYNTDLFKPATIQGLLGHFQTLLESAIADSTQAIDKLPLLSTAEQQQLLVAWNQTQTEYPHHACVHHLFEAQAQNRPDAVAVVFVEQTLTYQELNCKANQLAHYLQTLGIGSETVVGVCLERSPHLIIALLAILKVGGAYLPLDPAYPPERLALMVENAQLQAILTQADLSENLPPVNHCINLDAQWPTIATHRKENLNASTSATSLAYVMYTSGSTGQPKGVSVLHRNIVRLVKNTNYATFTADDVFLQLASVSFDAATLEIWGSLLNGSRLVLLPERHPSLAALGQLIQQQQVTVLWLTAGLFHLMVDEQLDDLQSLRLLMAGGDVLSVPHVEKCRQALPDCQLMNGYGPTENTVFTCCYPIPTKTALGQSIPIGRPIANTQVYILDAQRQPVPIGVTGELYAGGDGLARGYFNRPDLTAERFISNPFVAGDRLYKTGDLARYLPDGTIEFLGRRDNQVKVRGFRIELGEIEAVLSQHPQVQQVVVIIRQDRPDDKSLVVYVKGNGTKADRVELRQFLQQKLPDYMLPSAIVWLESLPLTPNGKVDRRALPVPEFELERQTGFVAPRTATEAVIANIIATILGQERVSIQDNFFELGGHSLLATQAISRIRRHFGVELPLKVLFEQPILADLARSVEAAQQENLVALPPIQSIPRTKLLPLSFAQQRLWFLDCLEGASPNYNMSRGFKLEGTLNRTALAQSLQAIVRRHESLRTTFQVDDRGIPYQCIAAAEAETLTLPAIELQDLHGEDEDTQVKSLMQAEAQQPFDISCDRPLRFKLLRLSPTNHVLLVTIHHIISDGWSMGVFHRELLHLYQAFCEGQEDPLPPLTIQYADFASWQRQWLTNEVLENQLNYWKQQLADTPPLLELPTDAPRPAVQTFRGGGERFQFDLALTQQLKDFSQKAGVTLFMTLLAAFQVLLFRYSRQTDIVVGSPIANRNQAEIEPLIGFFVNTLVLRSDLSGNPTFEELLAQVKQTTLDAYAHQDLPFEKLVEELQPQRRLDCHPLVQVVFALQNAPDTDFELLDVNVEALELEIQTTREFDLELHLWDKPQGLVGLCVYSSDLFAAETIQQLWSHFQILLQAVVADSCQEIGELSLMTAAEQQILQQWNRTQRVYPQDQCIHQLFEAQVKRQPDAVALVCGEQQLTYQVLNQRANQLAERLRVQGVQPETLVGIYMERSLEMVIGLLGILKAGGAYVPLDPNYPAERLAFMLADTQVPIVLTQTALQENVSADSTQFSTQLICLDKINWDEKDWEGMKSSKDSSTALDAALDAIVNPDVNSDINSENLAYVMYTSGSTGQPKGVSVRHQGVVRLVCNTNYVEITPNDTFLQLATIAFDAATFEIWGALLNGAKLVLVPASRLSLAEIGHLLQQHQISILWLTAGVFHQMVEDRLDDLATVRQLLAGGDVLSVAQVQKVVQALPNTVLINGYGPTENTTFTCCYPAIDADAIATSVPIGRPIANTQVYVLDDHRNPVPIGVSGELYIGGDGLARGYFRRPELTRSRFITHKFNDNSAAIPLYRTGDIVRYRGDGNLEFLGRADRQVKIRGFRIELAEIESVLESHAALSQAVVIVSQNQTDDKSLIAYLVPQWQGEGVTQLLAQAEHELLADWQVLYEDLYNLAYDPATANGGKIALDPNFVGWNSSYSGQPIPEIEMKEWLESTVCRIRSYQPQSILEIGCGTGLLMSRLAPECDRYEGTDYSSAVIEQNKRLQQTRPSLAHVTLHHKLANDFEDIPKGEFDTVILNSIVQYFPSVDYLLQVLAGAIEAIGPQGRIFIGDVRHLPLLEAFHTLVQFAQAEDTMVLDRLQLQKQRSLRAEEELVIDPSFFVTLPQYFPQISQVEIQPKRGQFHNELTLFRYDVTLHLGPVQHHAGEKNGSEGNGTASSLQAETSLDIAWRDWQSDSLSPAAVCRLLSEEHPETLGIRRIANARLQTALQIQQYLETPLAGLKTVEQLRQSLAHQNGMDCELNNFTNNKPGVGTRQCCVPTRELAPHAPFVSMGAEPDVFWQLGEDLGYQVQLSWWEGSTTGCYDVVFVRQDIASAGPRIVFWQPDRIFARPWHRYTNTPLQGKMTHQLTPVVRQFLQNKLPDYMVPQQFVVLEQLPLTVNGKVDRKALPAPDAIEEQQDSTAFVAPTTPTQELLAAIWSEVLAIERISIDNRFFELGGHSLLATQTISRIRHSFGVELPLKVMFEQPTLADLAQAVEAAQKSNLAALPPIQPIPRTELLPLSFAQQRLWFLDRLQGAGSGYNMFSACQLEGNLDRAALERSLQTIVQRHEALRTIFQVKDGVPYQDIRDADDEFIDLSFIDLGDLQSEEQKKQVQHLMQAEAQHPFDISHDSLIRCQLLRLSPTVHVLLITMHHIVSDGWSIGVFQRELSQLYPAFCQGQDSPLPPLKIQYADFACWQRQWLADQVLETQLNYWKHQLAGIPPLLELPADYSRPAVPTFQGRGERFHLDATLSQQLKALSQKAGVTLFMTLLAVFQILLSRYSGQTDIVVGSPIANRNQAAIEPLIGFFVNTLALRSDLSGNPSFRDLLSQVRQTTLAAYTHQDLPFEKLVEALQPERRLDRHPVVQVVFALQNLPSLNAELSDLKVEALGLEVETTREFDLELHLQDSPQGLRGFCVYRSDLFKAATIRRLLGHFQTLLQAVVADSCQAIGHLPLLTSEEQQQQLLQWNQIQTPKQRLDLLSLKGEIPLILSLLKQQREQNPNAVAVRFQDWQLSYQALHARANQLAHYLQTLGVGPETVVGVCVERSPDLVTMFLGILKAGGAYLPLDPAYPSERLAYMLADAQVSVLLTQPHLLADLPSHQAQVSTLEENAVAIAAQPTTPPPTVVTSETLAYVIYTSGSTGRPKGVMVTHQGVGNLACNLIATFGITTSSRILQFASPSFDASIMEMLMALGAGACLCFGASESLLPGATLVELLRRQAISHILLPPSALAILKQVELPCLEALIVGGEACSVPLMQQWSQGRRFFNAYGPTEATVCTTIALCQPEDNTITIGRPIANSEVYILDTYGQLVPVGIPGELYIGGVGLARGYLNRPDITQEKFVEIEGVEGLAGKRLYKTGDRVRYRGDGAIEFLGRIDSQVKLRGFRIELGEVSATLERHGAVQAAIALLREDRPGEKQLVAYGILKDEQHDASPTELREFLQKHLPSYMVPTAIVVLPEFPLTPNGKLDRRALPPPPLIQSAANETLPKTEIEQKIAAIWQQLLSVDVVGLDDNFFELGGHSLLLAQLQEQLQNCFKAELPTVELFARPTVRTLAQFFSMRPADQSTKQFRETMPGQRKRQETNQLRKRQQQLRRRYRSTGEA